MDEELLDAIRKQAEAEGYRIEVDKETDEIRRRTREEARAMWGKKAKTLYEIFIHIAHQNNRPGGKNGHNDKYSIFYSKSFGNSLGGATGAETKEQAIQRVRRAIEHWNEPDHMAPSTWQPVSEKNTVFGCYDGSIT